MASLTGPPTGFFFITMRCRPGAGGTLQNSQCLINGALSTASGAGTDLILSLSITRQGAYATGTRNLYIWVTDNAGAGTGWVQASNWTL